MAHAPSIERYLVRLRLAAPVRFHFLHGAVLRGLLSRTLGGHELPEGVVPAAAESGCVRFEAGEAYHLGLTFVGEDRAAAARLLAGLQRVGRARPDRAAPPTLGGNFSVEAAEPLPAPDLDAEAAALTAAPAATLQLLSPLRLERPPALKVKGAAYLNGDCFPAPHFLDRLAARVRRLSGPAGPPPPTGAVALRAGDLPWIDMPAPGADRKPRTLGGVLGQVVLEELPEAWLPWLVLARHLHLGAATGFAFGRFRLRELEERFPEPFRPARGTLERAAVYERLHDALDHVLERSDAAGEDGIEPDDYARGGERRLGELARDLTTGRYRPSALAGCLLREDDGVRALAFSRDRSL